MMKTNKLWGLVKIIIPIFCFLQLASYACAAPLIFISTQLNPTKESMAMRHSVLRGFDGEVLFRPYDNRSIFHVLAKDTAFPPGLFGGTVGDFASLKRGDLLKKLQKNTEHQSADNFLPGLFEMGRLGTQNQYFIPWMQATYLMVAQKAALQYLPAEADLNHLTYQQLIKWSATMHQIAGTPKTGFPASPQGLIHRFVQGYLYPSFTGGMVRTFRDADAVVMWQTVKELWKHVNVHSLSFSSMCEPLLSGEVWLAWDHTSRLLDVFKKRPGEFIAFPAPVGPKGRGCMLVLAGLGIPKISSDSRSVDLIKYLISPQVQLKTFVATGFFPVTLVGEGALGSADLDLILGAVSNQISSKESIITTLPYGFGEEINRFNLIYRSSFTKIVLRNKKITKVLDDQTRKLQSLLATTYARCFPPDAPSIGPCPVR